MGERSWQFKETKKTIFYLKIPTYNVLLMFQLLVLQPKCCTVVLCRCYT